MSLPNLNTLHFESMDTSDDGLAALRFRPHRPLRFEAGQHGLWIVPKGGVKPFTIASAPAEDLVMLATNLLSQSRVKRALAALVPGSSVKLIGPFSGFTLDPSAPSVIMLAQGIGVTPFRSMLRHAALLGSEQRTTLVHVGERHAFRSDTEADATDALYPTSRDGYAARLTAIARRQPSATFMVSGAPEFVKSTAAALLEHGIGASQVKRDSFYGYSPDKRKNLVAG